MLLGGLYALYEQHGRAALDDAAQRAVDVLDGDRREPASSYRNGAVWTVDGGQVA